jgi:iron complex transport system substrate-binding protein
MRIVSLLPAATEICWALGLGKDLVGVSPECDYPPAVRGVPVVSRTLLSYEGASSAETSRMVGERLQQGGALYQVDARALAAADPDLILTQGLCQVCAPTLGDVEDVAKRLPREPRILSLDPHRLEDILDGMGQVGRTCGVEEYATSVVEGLRARVERVRKAASVRDRPRTACLEWLEPLFAAGHWVPEMVALAGGEDVLARPMEPSRRIEPKDLALAAPEVLVLMPCGFDLARTAKEAPAVTATAWFADLPAPRRDRVWLVDGSSYFNRPGPRVVDGLEILAHILHPERFPRRPRVGDARRWVG